MTAGPSVTPTDKSLEARYADVRARIAGAARKSGRRPDDVVLVAVTKYAEPDQIRSLIQLGHRDFGENRVQNLIQRAAAVEEFLSRRRTLPHARAATRESGTPDIDSVRWHMIGHLQRNKVRKAVEFCRLIHSVDSLRLAEEIHQIAMKRDKPMDVLVQVNCTGEAAKSGCPVPAAAHLAEQIDTMVYCKVRGLMTMAALPASPSTLTAAEREAARSTFARCHELFEEIRLSGVGEGQFNILSMGMSGDYDLAIEEGANLVRVGTAIFGEPKVRPPEDDSDEGDDD